MMKLVQRLRLLFRKDLWWKLLSIGVALVLWASVVQDYNKETSVSFDVPLGVISHPSYEIFEGRQDLDTEVEVRVTGPNLLVSALSANDFRAWVDYGTVAQPGRAQDVPVQYEGPDRIEGQVRMRVSPPTVSVTLVENKTVAVPVLVSPDAGVVSVGDREFRYQATPVENTVPVSGRSDFLSLVRTAVVPLERADLEPPVVGGTLREPITRLRKQVRLVDAVMQPVEKLEEHYAEVDITWDELPPGRQVQVEAQTVGTLPPGFELAGITVAPSTITIRSANLDGALPDVAQVQTEPIDLSGQSTSFSTVARVITPAGTSAAQTSVEVNVSIREIRAEKVFGAVPIVIHGTPQGNNVDVVLSTPTVEVTLTGPYTRMLPLDASAIQAYVEVDGLTPGTHRVPVKVSYPPEIVEMAVDPAIVEVSILIQSE
jgi:YbbR domain-containing protein